jgi:hypothetical protein
MNNRNLIPDPSAGLDAATLKSMPYQYPQAPEMLADLWFIPPFRLMNASGYHRRKMSGSALCLNRSGGYWMNLLKVRKTGILSRHRHPGPVHALVLKGRWRYLEHDWVAYEGSYAFEPPGETHTLIVDEGVER